MAILIVEHNGTLEGASLIGRILIGRRASNHVVINHPAVSRIHAWIDTTDRQFCITDAGSRTGTFVNGVRVEGGKLALRHGDRITVGPASLIFRADASLPAGVSQLNFGERTAGATSPTAGETIARDDALAATATAKANGAGRSARPGSEPTGSVNEASPASAVHDDGILFDCPGCRAPLWVAGEFGGRLGKCRFCGAVVHVPKRPGVIGTDDFVATAAPPAPQPPAPTLWDAAAAAAAAESAASTAASPSAHPAGMAPSAPAESCGACQSHISPGESSTACPACGLTFHADCWAENYGCSAYGCSQVNALLPSAELAALGDAGRTAPVIGAVPPAVSETADAFDGADRVDAPKVTIEYALLAGSVLGVVLGALTFGVPALLACAAALVYINRVRRRGSRRTPRVVLAAALLALVGAAGGAAVSYVWWLGATGDANAELPLVNAAPEDLRPPDAQP